MQTSLGNFINNQWLRGEGEDLVSHNPATSEIIWTGKSATKAEIDQACQAALKAFKHWSSLSFDNRSVKLYGFQEIIQNKRKFLAEILSLENGKPLWEADTEIGAMINKLPISVEAYRARCPEQSKGTPAGTSLVKHRAHGPLAVFSPFNFPAHLPNGHIIPALLAGNTVVLKSSPLTPYLSEFVVQCWEEADLPPGVINLIQGGDETGKLLVEQPQLKGILFTGSYPVGQKINMALAKTPEKILALELGGNNPLVVHDLKNENDIKAAVYHTIQSAYITAGQRCTCARRLILTKNPNNEKYLQQLIKAVQKISVGPYTQKPEPFMGPVISRAAKDKILASYDNLKKMGAKVLVEMRDSGKEAAFISPGLVDVTEIKQREDAEIFGPLLQLVWVKDFAAAIEEANNTQYGLVAGLLGGDKETFYDQFYPAISAGLINWNRPLTGASGQAPFGGIGRSGNYRPAGFYAADYCAYPVASLLEDNLILPEKLSPGLSLE